MQLQQGVGLSTFNFTLNLELVDFLFPVTVRNSNESFFVTVQPGGTLTLDDYDFEFQLENETVISNEIRPAMVDETFIITANTFYATVFNYNLNVNGVFKEVVQVDVNSDINININ